MSIFKLNSSFQPQGDQPTAIKKLVEGVRTGKEHQVLLGVTGSGKTFTMACVIAELGLPTLVLSPNKALAAQLFEEFKGFFPENAVEFFVSYYDYYQPEAYVPEKDLYIEKETDINEEIDRLRHSATHSLLTRNDVIIVASVSCIYGLGSAETYSEMQLYISKEKKYKRRDIIDKLIEMQYERNDIDFHRGTFRTKGDTIDIFPPYEESLAIRIVLMGETIESIKEFDPITGITKGEIDKVYIFPGSHYATTRDQLNRAIESIKLELKDRLDELYRENKLLEAQRLEQRVRYDLEMLIETGYCNGIENYSRHFTNRRPGEPPPTLLDYFPKNFLTIIDESHITIPQLNGMYNGDRTRKQTLVDYGFRLPSALDNRPLKFEEFTRLIKNTIYVSATPGPYELSMAKENIAEQIIRPTGLIDPEIEVKSAQNQIEDLIIEIKNRIEKKERVLVTTLTKRFAEELTEYLESKKFKVKYMHSDIDTLERIEIIRGLRKGEFDILIGINLLREGLDLPEVSLVAILDADKEGFLRSERSLIQTIGRASRNINGKAILYADKRTEAIEKAISETNRRRERQLEYNKKFGITPRTIIKRVSDVQFKVYNSDYFEFDDIDTKDFKMIEKKIAMLKKEMLKYASNLEFEKAAEIRDEIRKYEKMLLKMS
ncbi:MAG: excinuclease ABC subunit UvrB [Deltaproteobacteria bacterium]|nr:excinuclease ABC subunit UvrB [Deltaproteobacteria bacterium]